MRAVGIFAPRWGKKGWLLAQKFKRTTLACVDVPKYQDGLRRVKQWIAYTRLPKTTVRNMNGDSKFLTLAALGVIGLGSAMPYWSAWSTPPQEPIEATAPQAAAHQTVVEQPFNPGTTWDQQVSHPDVVTLTPRGDQNMGLDNPARIPSLSMSAQESAPIAAQPIMSSVPISPVGSVTLASREEVVGVSPAANRVVVPIEIPGSAKPLPPTMTSPVITTRQVMKPELPETQVRGQFTPLPQIAPPHHGASNGASQMPREHRVRDGDSLEMIAEKYLGDPLLANVIFQANRDRLQSPDLLPIGVKLTIPSQSAQVPQETVQPQTTMARLQPSSVMKARPVGSDVPRTRMAPPRR